MNCLNRVSDRINNNGRTFFAVYTLLFILLFACFSFGCLARGKGFIWSVDGLEQQYAYFIMQGNWMRELLNNVFVEQSFVVPMWTDSIGYGADYVYSLGNTMGNPINWLAVFATPETADYWLNATVPLTLYLAGLSFLGYARYKQFEPGSSLIGCFVYIFGGYSVIAFTQIYLLYPLVVAPLVVWGVDKIFEGESPIMFVFGMFLCFFCSVSLAYTTCISLGVYCLIKVFNLNDRITFKGFFVWVFKILGWVCLAALVAAVMFLPGAMALLDQGRLGLDRYQALFYSPSYYITFIEGFTSYTGVGEDCFYGFAPIAILSVFCLFLLSNKKEKSRSVRILRIAFVVFTAFLCLPFIGRLYNGMAYANNRWVWSYCLLVSVLVAFSLPRLRLLFCGRDHRVVIGVCAYSFLCLSLLFVSGGTIDLQLLVVTLMVTLLCYLFAAKKAVFNSCILGSIVLTVFLVSFSWGNNNAANQVDFGESYDYEVRDNPSSLVSLLPDSGSERFDCAGVHSWRNGNIATGLIGSSFYNSLYNSYLDAYHTSLGLATSSFNFAYNTFNSRTTMEALAGVKYFLVHDDEQVLKPPLYDKLALSGEIQGNKYKVYEASESLPLAFCYADTLSREEYDRMDPLQRQDVLTQAMVLETDADSSHETVHSSHSTDSYTKLLSTTLELSPGDNADELPLNDGMSEVDKSGNVEIDDNSITTYKPGITLYFNVDIPAGYETYFMCEGMDFEPLNGDGTVPITGVRSFIKNLKASPVKECKILVFGAGMSQEIWQMNNRHHMYGGKNDWAVNTGTTDFERHTIALRFEDAGTYSFDSFGLYGTDVSKVQEDIRGLSAGSAQIVRSGDNSYEFIANATEENEYLYMRIPYSKGWKAEVDGAPVEIERANLGFMAIPISEGSHSVSISYETPYLAIGSALSIVGLSVLMLYAVVRKRRKEKMIKSNVPQDHECA